MLIINANGKYHFAGSRRSLWAPGVPAMQAARSKCQTEVMLSRVSPPTSLLPLDYSALHSARQLSSMRLEKPHSLSYQANTFSNLPLTLV